MAVMPAPAVTELPPEPKASVKFAAWLVLSSMGGTSVTYQVWHATHAAGMDMGLAVLYGIAPVLVSMSLSHIAAEDGALGRFLQWAVYLSVALAMALSASAVAAVVAPAAGPWKWAFGLVLDGPSLISLRVIIVQQERKVARKAAEEAMARATQEASERAAAEAAKRAIEEARARAAEQAAEQARIEAAAKAAEQAAERAREIARRTAERASKDPQAEKARREYRKSLLEGNPLTDRALAAKFPGRARTWAAGRIAEVKAMTDPQASGA